MADNSLFPRKSDIFKGSTLDIRDTLGRVSLDALYQVTFSFGKSREWLRQDEPGKNRTQGTDFKRKMSDLNLSSFKDLFKFIILIEAPSSTYVPLKCNIFILSFFIN